MKKILFLMVLSVSFIFSAVNLQTASKDELMCLKGIGEKKADAIILYRKKSKLKSADDLIELKGFGKGIIASVKKGTKTVKCGGKKTTPKKTTPKKTDNSKKTTKKSDSEKTEKKKTEKSKKSDSKKVEETTKKDKEPKSKKETKTKEKKETKTKEKKETKKKEDK